jgi:hypothetical protein
MRAACALDVAFATATVLPPQPVTQQTPTFIGLGTVSNAASAPRSAPSCYDLQIGPSLTCAAGTAPAGWGSTGPRAPSAWGPDSRLLYPGGAVPPGDFAGTMTDPYTGITYACAMQPMQAPKIPIGGDMTLPPAGPAAAAAARQLEALTGNSALTTRPCRQEFVREWGDALEGAHIPAPLLNLQVTAAQAATAARDVYFTNRETPAPLVEGGPPTGFVGDTYVLRTHEDTQTLQDYDGGGTSWLPDRMQNIDITSAVPMARNPTEFGGPMAPLVRLLAQDKAAAPARPIADYLEEAGGAAARPSAPATDYAGGLAQPGASTRAAPTMPARVAEGAQMAPAVAGWGGRPPLVAGAATRVGWGPTGGPAVFAGDTPAPASSSTRGVAHYVLDARGAATAAMPNAAAPAPAPSGLGSAWDALGALGQLGSLGVGTAGATAVTLPPQAVAGGPGGPSLGGLAVRTDPGFSLGPGALSAAPGLAFAGGLAGHAGEGAGDLRATWTGPGGVITAAAAPGPSVAGRAPATGNMGDLVVRGPAQGALPATAPNLTPTGGLVAPNAALVGVSVQPSVHGGLVNVTPASAPGPARDGGPAPRMSATGVLRAGDVAVPAGLVGVGAGLGPGEVAGSARAPLSQRQGLLQGGTDVTTANLAVAEVGAGRTTWQPIGTQVVGALAAAPGVPAGAMFPTLAQDGRGKPMVGPGDATPYATVFWDGPPGRFLVGPHTDGDRGDRSNNNLERRENHTSLLREVMMAAHPGGLPQYTRASYCNPGPTKAALLGECALNDATARLGLEASLRESALVDAAAARAAAGTPLAPLCDGGYETDG